MATLSVVPVELQEWLINLDNTFKESTPNPDKIGSILDVVQRATGVNIAEYVGAGDNGIAFRTDKNTVLKFTIDSKEATLWSKLQEKAIPGIIPSYGSYHLIESNDGQAIDTIVYVVHVGYIQEELNRSQISLIRQAVSNASEDMQDRTIQYIARFGDHPEKSTRHKMRTMSLVKAFYDAADRDRTLQNIPEALIDLADSYESHLFDLTPQNFRADDNGYVVLVDPSLPDMSGPIEQPKDLMFESKLEISLYLERLHYG